MFPTVLGRSTCLHPLYQRPFTVRERARACALPDWVDLRGNLSQQNTQVGNLVPPPVAEAFGRELMIAAGLHEDDWSARAAAGFGMHLHHFKTINLRFALKGVAYFAHSLRLTS